ncbi:MAG: peptidase [Gemmatimonadetes bacterium]|nr:MAG: peptidase [Gemmatimonadota bacterium]
MKRSISISLAFLAACATQRPQVLTPIRVDTTRATVGASSPLSPASSTGGSGRPRTVDGDPLARVDRMEWPAPSAMRSASGAPGPEYWQQRADYSVAVTLDTTQQRVAGSVTIRYTNNSPDTLRFVWLQLDQNLYRPGSKGSMLFPADSRWGVRGFQGGYDIDALLVNGRPAPIHVDDTMGRIDLEQPLAPKGGRLTITMNYAFRVPEHGSDRMGRDGTLYEIAQWFPRMAVYDDIRGWNTDPYFGQGEFYLEYGDIDYSVTAPAGYTIAGSGVLQNPADVLTAAQRERLARAARSDSTVAIITNDEAHATPTPGSRIWRFRAQNVRDVAWAGAPDFRWDAVNANGVLAQAYYQVAKSGKAWEQAAEQTAWTIKNYSELVYKYPYPQATSVAGPVGGMEYPMFVMVHYGNPLDDPRSIFGTINHEHGHEWFPMIVGSNERRYAWQDEGFNTYINAFALERRTPGTSPYTGYVSNWRQTVENRIDAPLMTPPDRIDARALGALGYRKPAVVLLALRDNVVGRATFDRAFREYTQRWAFKHPSPGDFFRTIENVSGMDLGWYWRSFWYSTDVLDIGIDNVTMRQQQGQNNAVIALRRNSSVPFPVRLRLLFRDNTTQDVVMPVEVWSQGERIEAVLAADWKPTDDAWGTPVPAAATAAATSGGLSGEIGGRPLP